MSVVDLPARKQHGDLGYTAVSHCLQSDKEHAGDNFAGNTHERNASIYTIVVTVCSDWAVAFVLIELDDGGVTHVFYDGAFIPSCGINFIWGIAAGKLDSFQLDFVSVSDERGSVNNDYLYFFWNNRLLSTKLSFGDPVPPIDLSVCNSMQDSRARFTWRTNRQSKVSPMMLSCPK